jgi:Holliday junction resolvase RusA-like endonuclease
MISNVVILPITPQTHIRTTKGDKNLFRIPEECPKQCGKPRMKFKGDPDGCPHMRMRDTQNRINRIDRYNKYKENLLGLALSKKFTVPQIGAKLIFYIPIPKRVRSKKKRAEMHMTWHEQLPDIDNLLKAFFDSLMAQDSGICFLSGLGKKWVDSENGWIEITIPDFVTKYAIFDNSLIETSSGKTIIKFRKKQLTKEAAALLLKSLNHEQEY